MKRWWIFGLVMPLMVVADQVSKWLVVHNIPMWDRIPVIHGFFDLVHYRNTGMAFGLFRGGNQAFVIPFFVVLALAALTFIVVYIKRDPHMPLSLVVALSLVAAGAIGNAMDRVHYGDVVDFLLVYIGDHVWPAFNVADAGISVGAVLMALDLFRNPTSGGKPGSAATNSAVEE